MQQIIDYVEVMFRSLPNSKSVNIAKDQILDSMLMKYDEYIKNQMSEADAIGHVIGEFGNIDELIEGLGLDLPLDGSIIESQRLDDYLRFIPRFANAIAIGVGAIGFVIAMLPIMRNFLLIPLFISVILALSVFILYGFRMHTFEDVQDSHNMLSRDDTLRVKDISDRYASRFILVLIGSIAIMLLAFIVSIMIGSQAYSFSVGAVIFTCGLFLMLRVSIPYGLYDSLINRKKNIQYNPGKFSGLIMSLAVFAYLFIGFSYNGWHPWWIIILVAGVISGYLDSLPNKEHN
ncbi:hypothetical protein AOC36_03160 [Erysipelothrix larvae]|uniref:Beta-carotene 15,15'-monooxygenase n=1 Tax=Erysipelothrix larvae TaxID=1514105 RepID=A0A120JTI6_9FIRM|nr:permease prefix domain 1-containing protein [Erysipelothrix larvae]AMC93015.1 hypothetical protein AOC36_03160 [Erysipelothrix larvae]